MEYQIGQTVKVDLSSSGEGVKFLEIEGFEKTDNINGYRNVSFKGYPYKKSEYYIRPVKENDLKYKKIFDESFSDFNIDYDNIKREFWRGQKENLSKITDLFVNFLYPYLKDNGNEIELDKITDWDSRYKNALHAKNEYWFVIPHNTLRLIVEHGGTWMNLYVLLPNDKWVLYTYAVEYSDDEYVAHLLEMTKNIIGEFDEQITKNEKHEEVYYHFYHLPHLDYKLKEKLTFCHTAIDNISEVYNRELPYPSYPTTLLYLSCIKHNFFTWND